MNNNFVRAAVKRRLVEVGQQTVGTGVDLGVTGRDSEIIGVSYDWNGDIEGDSALYFGEIGGPVQAESVGTSPLTDDSFTVAFRVTVWGFSTPEEADEASMRVVNGLHGGLRLVPRLIGTYTSTLEQADYMVASCGISSLDGPWHSFPQSDGDDFSSAINGVISITSNVS